MVRGSGPEGKERLCFLHHLRRQYEQGDRQAEIPAIQKQRINGLEVLSPDNLDNLIIKRKVNEILIALPSISKNRRREIIDDLERYHVRVRSLPSISELAEGSVDISDLHVISIEDLLGRESVNPETNILGTNNVGSRRIILLNNSGLLILEKNLQ